MTTLTVGTFNVWRNATIDGFVEDLAAVLRTNVDVLGLQEVKGRERANLLDRLPGWGLYQPSHKRAEFVPIVWRESRFNLISVGSRRVARGIVGFVPIRYANWVELEDRVNGQRICVVNTHLHASISRGGKPRWWLPRTHQAYKHIAALADLCACLEDRGEVFIVGDFNIDYPGDKRVRHPKFPYRVLGAAGLVACWEWSRAKGGTHGHKGRKIDHVWHRRSEGVSPVKARILRDKNHSDHKPVLATYNIT